MDPWVTRKIMDLEFEWDQIQNSVRTKKYNSGMAMYLMLSTHKQQ